MLEAQPTVVSLSNAAASKLAELTKENQQLKEENDILKKAAIFFARGSS